MLKKKFEGNYEKIIAKEIEKKEQEVILRDKIDIWNMITNEKDNKKLDKFLKEYKKRKKKGKWKVWD